MRIRPRIVGSELGQPGAGFPAPFDRKAEHCRADPLAAHVDARLHRLDVEVGAPRPTIDGMSVVWKVPTTSPSSSAT